MRTILAKHKHRWMGVLAILISYFTILPMVAPMQAQTTVLGELTFKGASKVEKTSGVWIDGKYVGYLGELWGPKRILLIPGDHELAVRQAGYKDFTETLTVEPKELLLVPVKMEKETSDTWPSVTAQLKVDVQPDRAAVFVDDRFLGPCRGIGRGFSLHAAQSRNAPNQDRIARIPKFRDGRDHGCRTEINGEDES